MTSSTHKIIESLTPTPEYVNAAAKKAQDVTEKGLGVAKHVAPIAAELATEVGVHVAVHAGFQAAGSLVPGAGNVAVLPAEIIAGAVAGYLAGKVANKSAHVALDVAGYVLPKAIGLAADAANSTVEAARSTSTPTLRLSR